MARQFLSTVFELLYSAMLLGALVRPCAAQNTALTQPSLGIISPPTTVEAVGASTTCPSLLRDHRDLLRADVPADSSRVTCTVERVDTLGKAIGSQWYAVKYLTRYVFPADSIKRRLFPRDTADTSDVLDVLIYSSKPGDSAWKAQWQSWTERQIWRDIEVTLGVHSGLGVFSILSCINGTGGCQQHFLGHAAGNWAPLNETYYAELARRFGADAFWKGVNVDVRTLRGAIPLYSSGDANCCASREIRLALDVRGASISVKRVEVRAAR